MGFVDSEAKLVALKPAVEVSTDGVCLLELLKIMP
jgi:hypothetical protein